jgi:hypothetical protein
MISEPLPFDTLIVLPWLDPVVDAVGYDPRSPYVEHFWLGVLGPSTTFLLRRLAARFDDEPDGFELDVADAAGAIGLSAGGGRNNPFARTLQRCVQFGMAQAHSRGLAVRRRLPPVSQRQLGRLPSVVQAVHADWTALPPERERAALARAGLLARAMLATGDPPDSVERTLHILGVAPATSATAVQWALTAGGEEAENADAA